MFRHRIIDKCLRNHPFPSKEDLREACEQELFGESIKNNICSSTIEKDLFTMRQDYDAPIKYSKTHRGYYYDDPEFTINDVPLNESDIDAVKFAASTLLQFKDVALFKDFGNAIDKIVERITLSTQQKTKQNLQEFVHFETSHSIGGGEYLPVLLKAIQKSVVVYFEYENFNSETIKHRKVCPLLLKEYRNRWYLISYDIVKEKITTYALERIRSISVSDEQFMKPNHFNHQDFFKYAFGITTLDSLPEQVIFQATNIASKYIQAHPLHHSQKVLESNDQSTIFQLEVFLSEELIRTILSYGGELVVKNPQSLKKEIQNRIMLMQDNYKLSK